MKIIPNRCLLFPNFLSFVIFYVKLFAAFVSFLHFLLPPLLSSSRSSVDPCLPFQLLKEINRTSVSRALRIRRQAGQSDPRAYVTAHFKTLPLEFTLGDGRNYGDFRNRPLQNGQEYVFFVLALLDLSENVS